MMKRKPLRAAGRFQKAQDMKQNPGSRLRVVQRKVRKQRGEVVFKYLKPQPPPSIPSLV